MQDKRDFSRVSFKVSALLQADGVTLKGEVKDISMHGIFVQTEEKLPVGTPVEITIYLSAADPIVINVSGSVARCEETGLGCIFEKMDIDSFAHLRSVISYQMGDVTQVLTEFADYVRKKIETPQKGE
ncbi:PilZ domain-containing protein [Geomesophilobacter sediminis]|uniref:PilZ domain-containing protein n=1 Tax=Geomesophilobacter sediminis TaxID=2798584 RepID=A0A8J7S9I4_9BACT|nr:PilZ domain-containing protein [Geomesophilobacter sediminis]MBJ6726936.1 PilZ domain-containing protein [Geomesophilobacter sediminis]